MAKLEDAVRPTPYKQTNNLKTLYRSPSWDAIHKFLAANPALDVLLAEAYPRIQQIFGNGTPVMLKLVNDPESRGARSLFAYIQTRGDWQTAVRNLERLEDEWWLQAASRSDDLLHFDVEFV